jgi:hypothetical protein
MLMSPGREDYKCRPLPKNSWMSSAGFWMANVRFHKAPEITCWGSKRTGFRGWVRKRCFAAAEE